MPSPQLSPLAFASTSRASDLDSSYSDSTPDTENYFASSELESSSASHTMSRFTQETTPSRADSATSTIATPLVPTTTPSPAERHTMFPSAAHGQDELHPLERQSGLKRKHRFANLRQSISKVDLPRILKQLVGFKRSRGDSGDERQAADKVARTDGHCQTCQCQVGHADDIDPFATIRCPQYQPSTVHPLHRIGAGQHECLPNNSLPSTSSWTSKLGMFAWAGSEVDDFRRYVLAAESDDWVMED